MPDKLSKAARIREIAKAYPQMTSPEIAAWIARDYAACSSDYVRVVRQRSRAGGMTPAERQWRKAHPEQEARRSRRYYRRHKEEVLARSKAWRAVNLARVRARERRSKRNRRLRKAIQARVEQIEQR